jgi:hypothetical protein
MLSGGMQARAQHDGQSAGKLAAAAMFEMMLANMPTNSLRVVVELAVLDCQFTLTRKLRGTRR